MHYVKFSSVPTNLVGTAQIASVLIYIYIFILCIYIYTVYMCILHTKTLWICFHGFLSMFRGNLLPWCTQEESCIPKHSHLASTLWIAQYILKNTQHIPLMSKKKNWVTYLGKQKNSGSFISLNNLEWMKNYMLLFRLRKDFLLFCSVMKLKWSQWFLHIYKHRLNITNYTADRLHH